jgi:hypothetical protein
MRGRTWETAVFRIATAVADFFDEALGAEA